MSFKRRNLLKRFGEQLLPYSMNSRNGHFPNDHGQPGSGFYGNGKMMYDYNGYIEKDIYENFYPPEFYRYYGNECPCSREAQMDDQRRTERPIESNQECRCEKAHEHCSEQPCNKCHKDDHCKTETELCASVCVPITVVPCVEAGKVYTECCGQPQLMECDCDCRPPDGCGFVVKQNISVCIPLKIDAQAIIGEPSIECLDECCEHHG